MWDVTLFISSSHEQTQYIRVAVGDRILPEFYFNFTHIIYPWRRILNAALKYTNVNKIIHVFLVRHVGLFLIKNDMKSTTPAINSYSKILM